MNRSSGESFIATSPTPPGRRLVLSHAVLGMLLFVICEIMFFSGLISAYLVGHAGQSWPPPDQPRLPVWTTAFNTVVLLLSGWFVYRTSLAQRRSLGFTAVRNSLLTAFGLGAFFVLFQGFEWIRLIRYGLTMQSSIYGSFFYLIVGIHAIHALAGLCVLFCVLRKLIRKQLTAGFLDAARIFWYFVVGLWPILYILVYLN